MLGFLFGVLVGAAGFWAYRFWKGEEDTSWDQPFSDAGTSSYDSHSSEPVGSPATTGEATRPPTTTP